MKIIVKSLTHRQEEFNIDGDALVSELAKQVCEKFNFAYSTKLIYSGRIMNFSEKLSTYILPASTTYVVCMEEKRPAQPAQPPVMPAMPAQHVPPVPAAQPTQSTNNSTSIETNRAVVFAFLRLLSSHPIMNYLFFTAPSMVINMLRDGEMDSLLRQFTSQANLINQSMRSRENTMINITIDEDLIGTLMEGILAPNAMRQGDTITQVPQTAQATQQVQPVRPTTPESEEDIAMEDEIPYIAPVAPAAPAAPVNLFQPAPPAQPELTPQDRVNIQTLMGFGYPEAQATMAYLMSNKSVDVAANLLMDLS